MAGWRARSMGFQAPTPLRLPSLGMRSLDEADALYHGLRERDRTIASLQSKQRMVTLFEHLLDREAREAVATRLASALDEVRRQARVLALELARSALIELDIQALPRISELERSFAAYLDAEPSARLECCGDLITFLKEIRELRHPPKPRPPDDY